MVLTPQVEWRPQEGLTGVAAACACVWQMLLALTGHSNLHVSTLTMEFWEALRDVPMAQRAACLGPPLSLRILGVLLDRLSYPSSFTSWDKENAVDEEDFTRWAEGGHNGATWSYGWTPGGVVVAPCWFLSMFVLGMGRCTGSAKET